MAEKIFLFGQSSSGKSTISACLCQYIFSSVYSAPILNTDEIKGGKYLLDNWINPLREGIFPEKTDSWTIVEVDIGSENRELKDSVDITFFEIAGEQVRLLDPFHDGHSRLNDVQKAWIIATQEKLKESTIILMVGSSSPEKGDRDNLMMFLQILRKMNIKVPIAFIISKWDIVSAQFCSSADFAKKHYPEALKILSSFPDPELFAFSVGLVKKEGEKLFIDGQVDFNQGTIGLFNWIWEKKNNKKKRFGSFLQ